MAFLFDGAPFFGLVLAGLAGPALAVVAASTVAALIALYLWRERRRRVLVSFAPLWGEPTAGGRLRDRVGRRLRRWLSFVVQLIVLLLLLMAAADPRPAPPAASARSIVLLVDRSASMSAALGPGVAGRSRIDQARERAARFVTSTSRGDAVLIATFAEAPIAETGFEFDRGRLVAAIERIEPSFAPGRPRDAIAFAERLLAGRSRPTIVLVSDGAFGDDAPDAPPGVDMRLLSVGEPGDNAAILHLAVKRRAREPEALEVGLLVAHNSRSARNLTVALRAEGASETTRVDLRLEPAGRAARSVRLAVGAGTFVEARLFHADGAKDLLGSDDVAFSPVPPPPSHRVLVVGARNLYVEGALLGLGVTYERVDSKAAAQIAARWPDYDLVIFDGPAPAPAPSRGRYLYLGARGPGSPFTDRGAIEAPVASEVERDHPILAHVSLRDLNVREARRIVPGRSDEVIAASLSAPLIVVREEGDLKLVALSFDVHRSDLPLRPSFPLLLANTVEWMAGPAAAEAFGVPTGSVARLALPIGATNLTIATPHGERRQVPATAGSFELPLSRPGVYRIDVEGPAPARLTAAALLGNEGESDTRRAPAALPRVDEASMVSGPPQRPAAATICLLLALAFALAEWFAYNRRWTV